MRTNRFVSWDAFWHVQTTMTHRLELALELAGEGILPGLHLVLELGGCDSEGFWGNVYGLEAVITREENQRSGEVVYKERFMWNSASVSAFLETVPQREVPTIVTVVDVHAVTIVKAFQRAGEVNVEIVVARVGLVLDAREVLEQIFVHVKGEWPGREPLVVDGRVERERLVDNVDNLLREIGKVSVYGV